jgi:hypothetical protein
MTANRIHHIQISIFQLQKVGQVVCGLQPSEVAVDKLLQFEEVMPLEGGGDLQVVVNES